MSEILKLIFGQTNGGSYIVERSPINEAMPLNGMRVEPITVNPYGVIETKSARKAATGLQRLQSLGVVSPSVSVGSQFVVDDKTTSTFIEVLNHDTPSCFIKLRVSEPFPESADRITIISGSCLFDAGSAQARLVDGTTCSLVTPGVNIDKPVVDIEIDDCLSVYEIDTLLRLTNAINVLAPAREDLSVRLHVPRVEYYAYLFHAFYQGYLTRDQMVKWFDAVDTRSRRQFNMLAKRLNQNGFVLECVSPLDPLEEYIKTAVQKGNDITISAISALLASKDSFFASVLEIRQPESLVDLNYLGYQTELTRPGIQENAIAVAIDNPSEEPILVNAERLARDLSFQFERPKPDLIGLYVLPNTMIDTQCSDQRKRHLYFIGEQVPFAVIKQMVRVYRKKL